MIGYWDCPNDFEVAVGSSEKFPEKHRNSRHTNTRKRPFPAKFVSPKDNVNAAKDPQEHIIATWKKEKLHSHNTTITYIFCVGLLKKILRWEFPQVLCFSSNLQFQVIW